MNVPRLRREKLFVICQFDIAIFVFIKICLYARRRRGGDAFRSAMSSDVGLTLQDKRNVISTYGINAEPRALSHPIPRLVLVSELD